MVVCRCLSCAVATTVAQEKGGEDISGPYEAVPNWPKSINNDGWSWGSVSGVWPEAPNRIYILESGELPLPKDPPGLPALSTFFLTSLRPDGAYLVSLPLELERRRVSHRVPLHG